MTPQLRRTSFAVAALALAAGAGLAVWSQPRAVELRAFTRLPEPRTLPPAALDLGDRRAALAATDGRWTVLFFGFGNCPDVCPTTLALLARVVATLPDADRPRVVFLTVDPERDAQPKAAEFARWFAPGFLGATSAELPALAAALGAPYARIATADGYTMDHSGALFLLDPQGRYAAVATPPFDARALAADLGALAAVR